MATPNFDEKGRLPVRPLSYENRHFALTKEIIVDYTSGTIYVKTVDGRLINTAVSTETFDKIIEYIKNNSEIVTQVNILKSDGTYDTIENVLNELYDSIISIDSTLTKEGEAADAKAVGDAITNTNNNLENNYFKKSGGELTGPAILPNSTPIYGKNANGEDIIIAYIGTDGKLHVSSSEVPVVFDGPMILSSENYGFEDPSVDAVEGQIYLKLIDE